MSKIGGIVGQLNPTYPNFFTINESSYTYPGSFVFDNDNNINYFYLTEIPSWGSWLHYTKFSKFGGQMFSVRFPNGGYVRISQALLTSNGDIAIVTNGDSGLRLHIFGTDKTYKSETVLTSSNTYGAVHIAIDSSNVLYIYTAFYLIKYDIATSTIIWQRAITLSSSGEQGSNIQIALDPSNNIYVCGEYYDDWTGYNYGRVVKISSSGSFLWSKDFRSDQYNPIGAATAMACDSSGNVYLMFKDYYDTISGTSYLLVIKLSTNGGLFWKRLYKHPTDPYSNLGYQAKMRIYNNELYMFVNGFNSVEQQKQTIIAIKASLSDGSIAWQRKINDSLHTPSDINQFGDVQIIDGNIYISLSITRYDLSPSKTMSSIFAIPADGTKMGNYSIGIHSISLSEASWITNNTGSLEVLASTTPVQATSMFSVTNSTPGSLVNFSHYFKRVSFK
jgi:hypothetical protein